MLYLYSILLICLTTTLLTGAVDVTGRLLNSDSSPLPNIEVILNTNHHAISRYDGQFTFYNVSQGKSSSNQEFITTDRKLILQLY